MDRIVSVLSSVYYAAIEVDLSSGLCQVLNAPDFLMDAFHDRENFIEVMRLQARMLVDPSYLDEFDLFIQSDSLGERLREKKNCTFIYRTLKNGWRRSMWIAADFNGEGTLSKAVFCIEDITADSLKKEENEHRHEVELTRNYAIMQALSGDFVSVYVCNLQKNVARSLKKDWYCESHLASDREMSFSYTTAIETYIRENVHPDDRENLLSRMSVETVLEELKEKTVYAGNYRSMLNGKTHYVQFKFSKLEGTDELVLGFQNVDEFVASANKIRAQEEALKLQMEQTNKLLTALSREYRNVYIANMKTRMFRIIKLDGYVMNGLDKNANAEYPYVEFSERYIRESVLSEDQGMMLETMAPDYLLNRLKPGEDFDVIYRRVELDGVHNFRCKYIRLDEEGQIIIAYQNVDSIIREEREKQIALENALNEANQSNRAKTVFLNNMSHDIRTPMNAIMGFTKIAQKQNDNPDVARSLDKIDKSADHLLMLINDVLDISRIESGKVTFDPKVTDLQGVTQGIVDMIQGNLSGRNLNFVERRKIFNPHVLADALKIREVVVNLLSNAIKFTTDEGTVSYVTEMGPGADDRHVVTEITVSDTGIGMSKSFLEHIFDEFAQEENSARTNYKGTGLGMSIVKKYVDMMGGSIEIQSEQGKGSTFRVKIPMEIVDDAKFEKIETVPMDLDLHGKRVLLAEDNDLNAEIAQVMLEEMGIEVTRVADGKQAVDAFAQSRPSGYDAVLMDLMMPVMNGFDATRAIRSMDREDSSLPIIAMTASAFSENAQEAEASGMNGHIAKPVVPRDVINTLSGCFFK